MNKDFWWRVGKTFVQAVLAALLVSLKNGIDFTDKDAVTSLLVGLFAAGLSAVMNINKLKTNVETIAEETPEDEFITEDE